MAPICAMCAARKQIVPTRALRRLRMSNYNVKTAPFGVPASVKEIAFGINVFDPSLFFGKGVDGCYFKIRRGLGFKVFRVNKEAKVEWKALNHLRDRGSKIAPKPYLMKKVKRILLPRYCGEYRRDRLYYAIFMEHIYGRHSSSEKVLSRIYRELRKHGLTHNDCHSSNVLMTKKGPRVIDFCCASFDYEENTCPE